MKFSLPKALEVISNTPDVLEKQLMPLDDEWLLASETTDSWSIIEIISHLILGERTDWLPRTRIILFENNKNFDPFDMESHRGYAEGETIATLLNQFQIFRLKNIRELQTYSIDDKMLSMTGIHPEFGEVTLQQHLSAWVVHDLSHINQITRIMAKELKDEVGPWLNYMPILTR